MRRFAVLALAASLGLPAFAAEGLELSWRSRGQAAESSSEMRLGDAPFRAGRDPLPEILLRQEMESRLGPRGGCDGAASDFCYDLREGRIVYRRARAYMPRIDGLTAESISVKRDRIIFKYSF